MAKTDMETKELREQLEAKVNGEPDKPTTPVKDSAPTTGQGAIGNANGSDDAEEPIVVTAKQALSEKRARIQAQLEALESEEFVADMVDASVVILNDVLENPDEENESHSTLQEAMNNLERSMSLDIVSDTDTMSFRPGKLLASKPTVENGERAKAQKILSITKVGTNGKKDVVVATWPSGATKKERLSATGLPEENEGITAFVKRAEKAGYKVKLA